MMTLTLPWPPACLSPNAKRRSHWSAYAKPAKQYRELCWALALQAGAQAAPTKITFHPPDRRHRDADGMIGAFKHGLDGLADAIGIDDRHFRPSYHFGEPVPNGKIVVTIGEAA